MRWSADETNRKGKHEKAEPGAFPLPFGSGRGGRGGGVAASGPALYSILEMPHDGYLTVSGLRLHSNRAPASQLHLRGAGHASKQ